jgi:hypothetical protein
LRRPSCSVTQRNQDIVKRIKSLKSDHPFWGYRRVWARLKYDEHVNINKKRVLRLMRRHDLLVKPNLRLKAKRTSSKSKPVATRPNEWWGIDMTKVLVQSYGSDLLLQTAYARLTGVALDDVLDDFRRQL